MGGAMFSKSSIQFSVDGLGCVSSLLFDLRPNYGGGNEDNGDLLQKVPCKHSCTQCPQTLQQATADLCLPRGSWTLTGQPGSVFVGITVPFFWVLVCTSFCLCAPRVCFPCKSCVRSGNSMVVLVVTSSKRAYAIPRSTEPRAPAPAAVHC